MLAAYNKKLLSFILLNSKEQRPRIFSFLISMLFGCVLAISFPAFGIEKDFLKVSLFYVEHLIPFITVLYLYAFFNKY